MAKKRRRPYPTDGSALKDAKYGVRGDLQKKPEEMKSKGKK